MDILSLRLSSCTFSQVLITVECNTDSVYISVNLCKKNFFLEIKFHLGGVTTSGDSGAVFAAMHTATQLESGSAKVNTVMCFAPP